MRARGGPRAFLSRHGEHTRSTSATGRRHGRCARRGPRRRTAAARRGTAGLSGGDAMSTAADRLYELLPAIHRIRDAERGYPLRELMALIAEQVAAMEENLEQLY